MRRANDGVEGEVRDSLGEPLLRARRLGLAGAADRIIEMVSSSALEGIRGMKDDGLAAVAVEWSAMLRERGDQHRARSDRAWGLGFATEGREFGDRSVELTRLAEAVEVPGALKAAVERDAR